MELRHFRYFVAVAEALNFRRAAERLHVSAPTLSVQIKDLEGLLNARLFERDTMSVTLTAAGEILLEEARQVLEKAERAATAVREAAKGRRGTLRIGNVGLLSYGFIPDSLKIFRERYPAVEVELTEMDINRQAADILQTREIQIGFAASFEKNILTGTRHFLVYKKPLEVLLGTDHRLARKRWISLSDLTRERLLAFGNIKNSRHEEALRDLFRNRAVKMPPLKYVTSFDNGIAMIASGQELSIAPEVVTLHSYKGITFRPLKETGKDLLIELHAIWRKDETSPLVHNFLDILRTYCRGKNL
ncbi:LysR substrate-binding domain-containing protein [Termitidicoccus mucosus]|uniref:HTH lysR-type domain-containing protein n=1 Tax=Termitidicoccus mucosus TaxID=1184151 RepID=A0A178IG51_9BACT|nr:hypothetical protein AW736_16555 [Opitutaceae bacterium TSB47]